MKKAPAACLFPVYTPRKGARGQGEEMVDGIKAFGT